MIISFQYRNTGCQFENKARKYFCGWKLIINRERSTVSALCQGLPLILGWEPAGEARLGGQVKPVKIHKYDWNTNTHRKARNTQIQKLKQTNTNFTIGTLSQIRRGENEILLKKSSRGRVQNFWQPLRTSLWDYWDLKAVDWYILSTRINYVSGY